jgi:DNA-binding MarR family transcriptional regulator
MGFQKDISEQVVIALRRIIRAVDLHSRRLAQEFGLTGPQVVLLKELLRHGEMHVAELAKSVNLSHATVTDILNRLEKRGLIERTRSLVDRRRIIVTPTDQAISLVEKSPPLLHEQFSEQLAKLHDWEITQILSVLQRVGLMMDAQEVEASPLLATGSMTAEPEMVEVVTRAEAGQATDAGDGDVETDPSTQNSDQSAA